MYGRINALLIYFAFLIELGDDFFEVVTSATHAVLLAHAIFLIAVEIALIIIKMKEYFDKKE